MLSDSATEVAISIGNSQFTGKEVVVSELNINHPIQEDISCYSGELLERGGAQDITINITLKCHPDNFKILTDLIHPGQAKGIRNKKVDDCSVEELLFAIREKSKGKI